MASDVEIAIAIFLLALLETKSRSCSLPVHLLALADNAYNAYNAHGSP